MHSRPQNLCNVNSKYAASSVLPKKIISWQLEVRLNKI